MRLPTHPLAFAIAASLLPPGVSAQTAERSAADVARCMRAGPYASSEPQRSDSTDNFRLVALPGGQQKKVSLAEAWRVLLLTSTDKPFVNLKIERSQPDQHGDDRAVILEQMNALAQAAPAGATGLGQRVDADLETFALDQPSVDARGPLGFYTLLAPKHSLVVTAYFLNTDKAGSAFPDMKAYGASRDGVLEIVKRCMRGA